MPALHHLAIQVVDLPAMEAFYRSVFELPIVQRWPDGQGGERSVWLGLDGAFLALEKAPEGQGVSPRGEFADAHPGFYVFALRIRLDERAAWEARLARAGILIERRTSFSLFFRDPEGNRLAVSHHPEPAS
jgi:glyoxylase I family protein